MLPGIDDGAPDHTVALAMARMAWNDGIRVTACTPHIYPGLYENTADGIRAAIGAFEAELAAEGIPLRLVAGADVHLVPDLVDGLRQGRIPTLAGSRYFLFEPPHHVAPPRLEESVFNVLAAGYIPVITHPERLSWIEDHYPVFVQLVKAGAWIQVTAGAITGRFGRRPQYWAHRLEDEGLVHVVATDAHRADKRPPLLAEARDAVARRCGEVEALNQVSIRPQAIIDDRAPIDCPPLPVRPDTPHRAGFWRRMLGTA